ncbi:MAG: DUF1343 domain-containing protein [Candidatus Babeliales bacterium]
MLTKNKKLILLTLIAFNNNKTKTEFKLGIENIPQTVLSQLQSQRLGLITNQSGINQQGKQNIDILREHNLTITYVFAPEHGFKGTVGAEKSIHDSIDPTTNIPIISLYGNGTGKSIHPQKINDIDTLIFDIQDSGMRHYTYISTLLHTMQDAAEFDKNFIVLDRPNPLAARMEGPLVQKDLTSFISIAPIPLRHGMTIGELACYFNKHILTKPVKLQVIKMHNYNRNNGICHKFLAPLSPGIRSIQSCYNYSFLGLLGEIAPFHVGLKTDAPFQCILLPKKIKFSENKWRELQILLKTHNIESKRHTILDKQPKQKASGLRLHINNINSVNSFSVFLSILDFFKKNGVTLLYSKAFNLAIGTKDLQTTIAGIISRKEFLAMTQKDLKEFFERATQLFMYKPYPTIN